MRRAVELWQHELLAAHHKEAQKQEKSLEKIARKIAHLLLICEKHNHLLTCKLIKFFTCGNCGSIILEYTTLLKSKGICFAGLKEQPNVEVGK